MTVDEWIKTNNCPLDMPDELYIMRCVANTEKSAGEKGALKFFRDLKRDDAAGFLRQKMAMERDFLKYLASKKEPGAVANAAGPDEGTEKCVELCERLIAELTKVQ